MRKSFSFFENDIKSESKKMLTAACLARGLECCALASLSVFGFKELPTVSHLPWFDVLASSFASLGIVQAISKNKTITRFPALLLGRNFPQLFAGLSVLWPKRVTEKMWQPAFDEVLEDYLALKNRAYIPVLNFCFSVKMIYLIAVTIWTIVSDLPTRIFSNKRSK